MTGIKIELDWWVGCDLPGRNERWPIRRVVTLPAVPRVGETVTVPIPIPSPAVTSVMWTALEDLEHGEVAVFVTLEPAVATDPRTLEHFDRMTAEHGWTRQAEPVRLLSAETRAALTEYDESVRRLGIDGVVLRFGPDVAAETRIALKNYDHLLRTHGLDDAGLRWAEDTGLVGYGDDATTVESLIEPGFTDATADERDER